MNETIQMQLKILGHMKSDKKRINTLLTNHSDKDLYNKLINYEREIIAEEMKHLDNIIKMRYGV